MQSRAACKPRLSRLLLELFLNPNSCSLCYIASHKVLAERLLKSRIFHLLSQTWSARSVKMQTRLQLFTTPGTHHSMSGHFPRQIGLKSSKKKEKKKVLSSFSTWFCSLFLPLFFHLCIYLSPLLFSFPLPPPSSPSSPALLLLRTSNMSFFIFCTYRPFSLLNSPPSPLLWLSLSLSGA